MRVDRAPLCGLQSQLPAQAVPTGIPIRTVITFGTDGLLWATRNALLPSAEVVQVPPQGLVLVPAVDGTNRLDGLL